MSVPVVKGFRSGLNYVFALADTDLSTSRVISRMFSSFKKTCLSRVVKPSEWNLSLILRSLTHLPYEPMKWSLY